MTTVLHTGNVINLGNYAIANMSITYQRPGDMSSYGINIDQHYIKDLSSFGVRIEKNLMIIS